MVADLELARAGGQETVRAIEQAGGRAEFVVCDVSSGPDCEALVARVVERFGQLDFAHNNAGVGTWGLLHEISDEDFDKDMAVDLRGTFLGMKHQIRQMLTSGGGAIVNTASTAGISAVARLSSYVAAKHGVVGLTKSAAVEYADDGIRVNAVCPGAISSFDTANPELKRWVIAPQPMRRYGTPEEIAAASAWLCSDEASFVTGVALPVDGGSVAWLSANLD